MLNSFSTMSLHRIQGSCHVLDLVSSQRRFQGYGMRDIVHIVWEHHLNLYGRVVHFSDASSAYRALYDRVW